MLSFFSFSFQLVSVEHSVKCKRKVRHPPAFLLSANELKEIDKIVGPALDKNEKLPKSVVCN